MPVMDPYGPTPGGSGLSVPTQSPSTPTTPGAQSPDAQKAGFEKIAIAKMQNMAGTRGYLLDTSSLASIADRLWQSVSLQQLYAGYVTTPSSYAVALDAAIMNTVLNPALDPAIDPTIMSDYASTMQTAGLDLTPAMLQGLSNSTMAANASVPRPFDTSTISGYDFGQAPPPGGFAGTGPIAGWATHQGIDYGTRAGSRIVSPFAGTVSTTHDQWNGNLVTVTLDNGWKMSFGHVASGAAANGARVNPGDLIAISGANVGDSKGAVTLVTWQDPKGNYVNPHQVLDPIFTGTTFSGINAPGAAGTGMPSVNAILDREYPTIKSDWVAMFGSPPSPEDVQNVLQHGTSPTQWTDFIRQQPGHIPGMSVGSIYDLRTVVDGVSMTALGHAGTDGIVKELNDAGTTSQAQVKLWYDEHSPNEIDKTVYRQIATALAPNMDGAFNDTGVDPRMVKTIHDGQAGHPGPQQ